MSVQDQLPSVVENLYRRWDSFVFHSSHVTADTPADIAPGNWYTEWDFFVYENEELDLYFTIDTDLVDSLSMRKGMINVRQRGHSTETYDISKLAKRQQLLIYKALRAHVFKAQNHH